ncbi:Group 3 secretory phospholipase A2 [Oryzias melastigma]|uniref:phospholipase A2 n=1 Tax=Oryzias melastigma TaxID=30732 RepID=A0A834F8U3_ORYME|nr:Group 3 secretory phospholipase A2 [Oryzias melastigma]
MTQVQEDLFHLHLTLQLLSNRMVEARSLLYATFFLSCFLLSKAHDASDAGLLCVRSAAVDGQTSVTFVRQWSSGARSVYLTRWSQHSTLLGCEIHSDPSVVESYRALCKPLKAQDREVLKRFDIRAVLAPDAPCVLVPQKFSAPGRGEKTRRKRSWLFPGTLWCGTGSRAHGYHNLGMFERADVCCREHDHCQHSIPALTVSYGVFNHHLFSVSHCDCDHRFRQCLRRMNDSISRMVGYTFFNVLQIPCFELQHVKRCTEMYWWGMCKRAREAPYAVFKNTHPFDSSESHHKHVHTAITTSEEQHLTKAKSVDSQRTSSKGKPECESRDPPRGDTFHRRRKTGKACRRQKNLEEESSLQASTESPTFSMPTTTSERSTQTIKKERRAKMKSRRKDLSGLASKSHSNLNASLITSSAVTPSTQQQKFDENSTITLKNTTESLKRQQKNQKPCQCQSNKTVTFQRQCKICSNQENKSKTNDLPAKLNKNVSATEQKEHKTRILINTAETPSQKTPSSHLAHVTHGLLISTKFGTTPSTDENDTRRERLSPHLRWSHTSQELLERFKDAEKSVEENNVLQKENDLKCQILKHLDDCKFKISPLQEKYSLHNTDIKTVYHCDCTSSLAAEIKSFKPPSYLSSLLVDFVSPRCFILPKQNKCPHEERCSGGFTEASDLLEALKKAEEKGAAEMGFSANKRRRKIPVRLYKRCLRLQKEFDDMSKLR